MKTKPPAMKVPLLDLRPQLAPLRAEILAALTEVVDSTAYIGGPQVEALEQAMASYVGAAHAVGVSSGTDALLLALMGMGVGAGDLVITTPFSFFATAGVVSRLGARPVLVDIDPATFNLDPGQLEACLVSLSSAERARVKAIVPVHLFGQCADMDAIGELAARYAIPVLEDAAQAIGAGYPGRNGARRAGVLGLAAGFSFFPSKNLGAMGDAGIVTTDDPALADRMRILRNHGASPKYHHRVIGGNFRLDPLQAAVLLVKFPHLDQWHQGRQRNAETYARLFEAQGLRQIQLPHAVYHGTGLPGYHIYNQYVIRTPQRDRLKAHLAENGVATEIYYPVPFHLQECFADLGYRQGDFPHAEQAALEVLALPIYPELAEDMQRYVVEQIAGFFATA